MSKLPIDVPKEKLQQVRMDMFRKVQREKRTKKRIVSVAIASLFCLSLLFSIRVSPMIASHVAKIPGFQVIVSAVVRDKGIKDIVDNDYYEEINVTQSKKGLSLTLQGVIADNTGLVLYYDADASFDMSELRLEGVQLYQGDEEVKGGGSFTSHQSHQTSISSSVDYSFSEPFSYTSKDFKAIFHFYEKDKGNIEISVPFSLQNEIAKEKTTTVNRTVNVEGQKFTITKIRRSPLRMAIDIELDEANTMQILSLENIVVETEDGERREERVKNGLSIGRNSPDGKFTLNLQSNYFHDSDSLKLLIGAVHAVPKGKDFIEVDFGTKEVLTKPDYLDWDISVTELGVSFAAKKWDDRRAHSFVDSAVKADGTTLEYKSSTFSDDDEYLYETENFEDYDGKAKMYINYFFNPIGKNIELNIPLK
ncbi:hypothetical protein B1B04_24470 [Lysinibacillus sp. KCTC 33748]|uniref:DUF4179 domain-containing protein n=1 Tax=unclassified Lysinibacillus TaxID=2636778 RepID=UPI0009A67296|nr:MULTISPECIES: DUF4179 domain-containing protein [unclassified Lysinibacillus]OXS66039.1 hypothetical protein B1B04_24470 [Lysinibacillus sp. KCTC 33748]SKC18575.1 protein of unknown function [Lysinibacillus sp. AC-3]